MSTSKGNSRNKSTGKQPPTGTDMASRLARLELALLQKEEERLNAEKAKERKKREAAERSERRQNAEAKLRAKADAMIAAEVEKVTPAGWSLLDRHLRVYGERPAKEVAFRKAFLAHGRTFEIRIMEGFTDNVGYYNDDENKKVEIMRTSESWLVFGRPHPDGQSCVDCPTCSGVGLVIKSGRKIRSVIEGAK